MWYKALILDIPTISTVCERDFLPQNESLRFELLIYNNNFCPGSLLRRASLLSFCTFSIFASQQAGTLDREYCTGDRKQDRLGIGLVSKNMAIMHFLQMKSCWRTERNGRGQGNVRIKRTGGAEMNLAPPAL
jgi:hypothetical protein